MKRDIQITRIILAVLKKFLSRIEKEFPLKEIYVFGFYANGAPREFSDIDVAIVPDNFEGNRFVDREKLAKYVIAVSNDIEVHPFKTDDFTRDDPFVKEIIKTGIKINT